uniref:NADPH:adrenodoxin oxidoreductase, mitochondrial n=1 Tax=Steinernema glaseri TaxID=37863 RepID=A0A1I7YDR0_9BILA
MQNKLWSSTFLRLLHSASNVSPKHSYRSSSRIAVIGSGPAGLYLTSAVLRRCPDSVIDVFDKAPVPFGLVRYGVAPDHPEVKNCTHQFDRLFTENAHRLSLFCNVGVGSDISFEELSNHYDVVALAYGANRPRMLNVPGIHETENCYSGSDFVSWYNGLPGARHPQLDCENVVIVGNGNVALDCARILLSSSERLAKTDVPEAILKEISNSQVRNVYIVGRRGPLDISFTIKELREQINLPSSSFSISNIEREEVERLLEASSHMPRPKRRVTELLLKNWSTSKDSLKHCRLLFHNRPTAVFNDASKRVSAVEFTDARTGDVRKIECGLLIYSIGFENIILKGVPKTEDGSAIAMKDSCRVDTKGSSGASVYAVGWCANKPQGVIANTQSSAVAVAQEICADIEAKPKMKQDTSIKMEDLLNERGVRYVTWEQWKKIDEKEQQIGKSAGKDREKVMEFNI